MEGLEVPDPDNSGLMRLCNQRRIKFSADIRRAENINWSRLERPAAGKNYVSQILASRTENEAPKG